MQSVWRHCRHTCCSSAGEKEGRGWGLPRKEWYTGVEELLSSLSVFVPGYCLFTAVADMSAWQRQLKECGRAAEAGNDTPVFGR